MKNTRQTNEEIKTALNCLIGYKSVSGICVYIACIGLLFALIGLVCPLGGYNPTILDETERTFGILDISPIITILISLTTLVSIILVFISFYKILARFTKGEDWKREARFCIISSVIALVLGFVSEFLLFFGIIFYEIPEQQFAGIEIYTKFGAWLFVAGDIVFALCFLAFSVLLKRVADGKVAMEKLMLGNIGKNTENAKNRSEES